MRDNQKKKDDWLGSGGKPILAADTFGLMGIVNADPDSFFAPSRALDIDAVLKRAAKLLRDGADVIDLGGESTRPGAPPADLREETARVESALAAIKEKWPEAVVSVDTRKAQVAALALGAGAALINDVSGCADPELPEILAEYKSGYALTHCGARFGSETADPRYENIVDELKNFFDRGLKKLAVAGLPENRVALDPGIGFGKTLAHNLEILARVDEFAIFGRPILVGLSMKRMFGDLLGLPVGKRGSVSAQAMAFLSLKGVKWHRAHNIAQARAALLLAKALATGKIPHPCRFNSRLASA